MPSYGLKQLANHQSFSHFDIGLTKLNQAVVYDCASLVWTVKLVACLPKLTTFIDENNSLNIFV